MSIKMVTVTNLTGHKLKLNPAFIAQVLPRMYAYDRRAGAVVKMNDGAMHEVEEIPTEIEQRIDEATT